jgi:PucR-like helix-turn-helix protein
MVVGMSAPSVASADSPALLYAAASVAAGCAAVDPALPRCVSWPQLSLYRQLLTTSEQAPALLPLPTQPASVLEQTLEIFLDNACDVQRTAAALHIHRTTLYYRLARLRDAGFNLDDGLTRSHLHVALKQRRVELARQRFGWSGSLVHSAMLAPAEEANSTRRYS